MNAKREMLARQVMRPNPSSVSPEQTLARAADLMTALGVRELPVVEAETLTGIVTRSDLEPFRGHFEWTTVATVMTANPVTVEPDTPLSAVATIFLENGFNSVPVADQGRLVGMIGRADLVRVLARPN
jgi:CBS domain-containing protein